MSLAMEQQHQLFKVSPMSGASLQHQQSHDESTSTMKRSVPTPKTMIRSKPPPKPPRMKATMVDQSPDPTSPPREPSPGIISLKTSIVDATRTLDSPVIYDRDYQQQQKQQQKSSRLSPAKNSNKEYLQNILQQIKLFVMFQVDLAELLQFVCNQPRVRISTGVLNSSDELTLWNRLVTVVLAREEEGYRALCDGLRHVGNLQYNKSLLNVLHALDQLHDIGIATDSPVKDVKSTCSLCKFNKNNDPGEDGVTEVSKFDVEIICLDSETGQVKSLKELSTGKKPSRKLFSSPQERMLVKSDIDKYVPAISVSIFNQCLCNQGLSRIASLIQQYDCIRELYIVKNHLDLPSIEKLFQGMDKNYSLNRIDVRLNTLDDASVSKFFACLSGNVSLRVLNVASTGLNAKGVGYMIPMFQTNKVLTELDIGFNNIHDAGAKTLSQVLGNNCSLRKLRMRSNYITADGAKSIFNALKKNARLHFLDISVNPLKDDGCTYVSQALLCNRSLRELNLEDCRIRKTGCELVARALKTNTNLKSLDLSRNPLGDDGVESLSEGVKYNQVLDVLSLNMCEIANNGFSRLMDALQYNTTMTTLKLCYNLIGYPVNQTATSPVEVPSVQDIYERVCQILQTNKDLKVLLWGNRLDYDEEDFEFGNGCPPPPIPPLSTMNCNNSMYSNNRSLSINSYTSPSITPVVTPAATPSEEKNIHAAFNGLQLEKNGNKNDNNNVLASPTTNPNGTPLAKKAYSDANVSTVSKEKHNWFFQ